jgi:hypothetical protein
LSEFDWTPYQRVLLERKQVEVTKFFARYPHPFVAWIERQRSAPGRRFWYANLHSLPMEVGLFVNCDLFGGREFRMPTWRALRHAWFRAALELVDPRDSNERLICAVDLADVFGIPKSRYQAHADTERRWKARQSLPDAVQVIPPAPYLVKQFETIREELSAGITYWINRRLSSIK